MRIPLQVTFHGLDHSDAVEQRIREKAAKLDKLGADIMACRVVLEPHHRNTSNLHRKGEPYHVRIDVTLRGAELVVKRDPQDSHINEDIGVALREAFDAMERKIRDHVERQRG